MINRAKPWYRSRVVDLAVRLLYYSGLLHLVGLIRKYVGRKRLIILMYHRLSGPGPVAPVGGLDYGDAVPVRHFDGHMRLVRWFGLPVPVDEGYERLVDHSRCPRTLIAVTFDDGYRDNYALGMPVWERLQVPVTIFPVVGAVERGDWLWWDELLQIVGQADLGIRDPRPMLEVLDELTGGPVGPEEVGDITEKMDLVNYLLPRLKLLPMEIRGALLDELAGCLNVERKPSEERGPEASDESGPQGRTYMTWPELAEQSGRGVRVGGHTRQHPSLPFERREIAEREIHGCRTDLQNRLGQAVTSFAYPGGFHGDREVELVKQAGYRVAVTVEKGVNFPDANPYRLRRIAVSWDRPHHLAFKLAFCEWIFG